MSANQIPPPWPQPRKSTTGHDCTACWRNGGAGHTLAALLRHTRADGDDIVTVPVRPALRACNYWSAKKREHCGSTDQVKLHGCVGPRCATHTPGHEQAPR